MNKYNLKNMINGLPGISVKLPMIPESLAFRRSYLAEMRRLLRAIAKATRNSVVTSYGNELITDARESDFEALRRVVKGLLLATNETVKQLLELESIKHTDKFAASARSAFKIDLLGVIKAEDLSKYLEAAALRNAGLITGMTDDLVKRIQTVTTNSLINGKTVRSLRKQLTNEFKLSETRSQLIARDQTNKLNADLNRIRHVQAGVNKYTWMTSSDERVRVDHRRVDGEVYEYGKPTGTKTGAEPGQDIQCRCVAQGIVTFGDEPSSDVETTKLKPPESVQSEISKVPAIMAKNSSETADYVRANLAEEGDFTDKLPNAKLNEFVQALAMSRIRFGHEKLKAVKSVKKFNANSTSKGLAYYMSPRDSIAVNRSALVKIRTYPEGHFNSVREEVFNGGPKGLQQKASAATLKLAERSGGFNWFSVSTPSSRSIAFHEYGHRFHTLNEVKVDQIMRHPDFEGGHWEMLMSRYGMMNNREYVAESFALYMEEPDQHFRIYPPLLKFFKEKDLTVD